MLVSTALVMLMLLPGLALFYGGLVRAKNLLSVMSQVLGITAIAILTWVLWDYSLAFSGGNWLIGGLSKAGFAGLIDGVGCGRSAASGKAIPELVFAAFQMSFAAITGALVIGALVERVRFAAIMLFAPLWLTVVYAPLAHMVWASDGLLFKFGAIDFAGGTVVHINSGVAGLVGVCFAGSRIGHLKEAMPPHSLALTMVGAGLLWVGWFGFNAGSALEANGLAAVAMVNTFVAPAAGPAGLDGRGAARVGQAVDARRRFGRGRRIGRGHAGGGSQRTDRRDAARRRGKPRLLRLRRLAEEPAAARRQPRRVRDPWARRDYRLDRHRDRRAAGARRACAQPIMRSAGSWCGRSARSAVRSPGRRPDRRCASAR